MKKCSVCGQEYNDDSLNFCLMDGNSLILVSNNQSVVTKILPPQIQSVSLPFWVRSKDGETIDGNAKADLKEIILEFEVERTGFFGGKTGSYKYEVRKIPINEIAEISYFEKWCKSGIWLRTKTLATIRDVFGSKTTDLWLYVNVPDEENAKEFVSFIKNQM
ncbi:MAG TPA: hypothetical protein VF721_10555 [Pyrinomonadaceae bacterium]|jgi:hypothetical protein